MRAARLLDAAHGLREVVGPRARAAAEQLGVAADRRERRAQLVRRVGDEPAQPRLRRGALRERDFDLAEHRVEREAEPADLGSFVGGLDAPGEVAGGDRAGGVAHLLERPQPEAHDPPRQQRQREQHADRDEQLDEEQVVQRVVDVA